MLTSLTTPSPTGKNGDCAHCNAKAVPLFIFFDHEETPPSEQVGCEPCADTNYQCAVGGLTWSTDTHPCVTEDVAEEHNRELLDNRR